MLIVMRQDAHPSARDDVREWIESRGLRTRSFQVGAEVVLACGGPDVELDRDALAEFPGVLVVAAGPCSVESRSGLLDAAWAVRSAGGRLLRAGAYKPRTSPYSFQGLGLKGLEILAEVRAETGMPIVTEVTDPRLVEQVAAHADVLQVGARSMQNVPLLKELGRIERPVLLKRGLAATLSEFLLAAEYVLAGGNPSVILCERGIRSFDTATRFTLDLAAVPVLQRETHLPVFVDPSHAAGVRHLVEPLACAAVAAGADGLLVEVHVTPDDSWSDSAQAMDPVAFDRMMRRIAEFAAAAGRHLPIPKQELRREVAG